MVDKRSHTIHNKNKRKMVRRPTRYKIINVKNAVIHKHKIVMNDIHTHKHAWSHYLALSRRRFRLAGISWFTFVRYEESWKHRHRETAAPFWSHPLRRHCSLIGQRTHSGKFSLGRYKNVRHWNDHCNQCQTSPVSCRRHVLDDSYHRSDTCDFICLQ